LNCTYWKDNENTCIRQETIDTINEQLQKNDIPCKVDKTGYGSEKTTLFLVLEQIHLIVTDNYQIYVR
jgi:hypothetical protein